MSFYDDVHREAMRDPVLRDQEEQDREDMRREADADRLADEFWDYEDER